MRYNQKIKHFEDFNHITTFNFPIYNPDNEYTKPKKHRIDFSKDKNITRNDSLKRAKDKIFEIAYSNQFDYFVTLTINPKKCSRTNTSEIVDKLKNWLSNEVQRNDINYILIPEYHEDLKAIHIHGLIKGNLTLKNSGLRTTNKTGRKTIFNINNWKLGYSTAIAITGDKVALSRYIVKYVTKDTQKILGNIYYSGGKNLIRSVKTSYNIEQFYKVKSKQFEITGTQLKVKYEVKYNDNNNVY